MTARFPELEEIDPTDGGRVVTSQAPTNSDGSPILVQPHHRVSPLDLSKAQNIVSRNREKWANSDADRVPFDDTVKRCEVRDSSRRFIFDGVRLSYVSSEKPHKTRWTDISIYRTDGNLFVTHRVGVSSIVHRLDCEELAKPGSTTCGLSGIADDELPTEERDPCPRCLPGEAYQDLLHSEPSALRFERDRHSVTVSTTPEDAIRTLKTTRGSHRVLGSLSGSAVRMAADRDPMMCAVFYGKAL